MKKIFFSSLVLLVIVLFFLAIYNFVFKKNVSQTVSLKPNNQKINTVLPKQNKIVLISDSKVLSAIYDKKNDVIRYYSSEDGTAWQVNPDGNGKKQISSTKINGLKNVVWSPDRSRVLMETFNDGKTNFYEYDYKNQIATPLKNGLDNAIWDSTGYKIFYKYFDSQTNARTLNVANPDGKDWSKLTDVTMRNLSIAQIPSTSLIAYWNAPSSQEETQLQTIGVTGGEAKTILSGRYGADYVWSPNGSQAIVSSLASSGAKKFSLGLVTIDGKYSELNIPTIASKCVWSQDNKTIYYALPGGIPDSAQMPDAYEENLFYTQDTFWKLDIATGQQQRIVDASEINDKYDATNMFLSPTEDALYFVNRSNQELYKVAL